MQITLSLNEIIELIGSPEVKGSISGSITGIAALESAQVGDLSFLRGRKYRSLVETTKASVVIVPLDYDKSPGENQVYLWVENPSYAVGRVCSKLEQLLWPKPKPGVHSTAIVGDNCKIDPSATIGPLCVIESGVRIGAGSHLQASVFIGRECVIGTNCWLMPQTTVQTECVLKDRIRLHSGVVIGSDGFGYETIEGHHEKVPQIGNVIVESDVEIGANSTIDRARFSSTVIGEGTKIDNQVQVAHNVVVGKYCFLCGQAGISGSTTLGNYVVLAGQAGVADHLTIGDETIIAGGCSVNRNLPVKSFVKGQTALPYSLEQRINVLRKRLPELFKRVDQLEKGVDGEGISKLHPEKTSD